MHAFTQETVSTGGGQGRDEHEDWCSRSSGDEFTLYGFLFPNRILKAPILSEGLLHIILRLKNLIVYLECKVDFIFFRILFALDAGTFLAWKLLPQDLGVPWGPQLEFEMHLRCGLCREHSVICHERKTRWHSLITAQPEPCAWMGSTGFLKLCWPVLAQVTSLYCVCTHDIHPCAVCVHVCVCMTCMSIPMTSAPIPMCVHLCPRVCLPPAGPYALWGGAPGPHHLLHEFHVDTPGSGHLPFSAVWPACGLAPCKHLINICWMNTQYFLKDLKPRVTIRFFFYP